MKNSFESQVFVNVDRDKAYTRAQEALADRIDILDFTDTYPPEKIQADSEKVRQLKEKFHSRGTPEEMKMKKTADILEAIVLEQGELSQWFGENAVTFGASDFDDILNGIDMLVRFHLPERSGFEDLALGIDVTFTSDTTNKFAEILGQIDEGKLAHMEYCPSDGVSKKGFKDNLPKVVIGVEKRTVDELQELWMEKEQRALETHRIQIMILKEIELQLETFSEYAISKGREDLADIYDSRLKIIRKILVGKGELYKKVAGNLDTDTVFFSITNYMRRLKKMILESAKKENESESAPLSLQELVVLQGRLASISGIDVLTWINTYAKKLRSLVQDPNIRALIRNNPKTAEEELSRRLNIKISERVA